MTAINTNRAGRLPDGIYPFGVKDWDEAEGPAGTYWSFTVVVTGGPYKGTEMNVRLSHSQQSKFMVDNWLDAMKVPEGLDIEGDYFVGKKFRGRVEQGTDKNGKVRADIKDFLPATKDATPAAPSKPAKKVGKKTAQVTDEGDDDEDIDDADEDTDDDEDVGEEEDQDLEDDDDADTDEDDDDTDEDEDEEEVRKPVKAKAKPQPAKKVAAKPAPKLPGKKFKKPF